MDFNLTGAELEFQDHVRSWLSANLVGEFAAHRGVGSPAEDDHWDLRVEWERKLAAAGLLGLTWPIEFGGADAPLNHEVIFHLECARARAPYWAGVQGRDLLGPMLLQHGSAEQKRRFLPPIMAATEFWCQGFSEPDAGSDLASVRTRARLVDGSWVVNGQKVWTSLSSHAQWVYLLCRTDPEVRGHRGLSILLLPLDQDGIEVRPIRTMAGGREFAEVFLTDAVTDADLVVGEIDHGWDVVLATLGIERGLTTLSYQATFEAEVNGLIDMARQTGGTAHGAVVHDLVDAWVGMRVVQLHNSRMLSQLMRHGSLGPEASLTKLLWTQWHQRFGELSTDVSGEAALPVETDYGLNGPQRSLLLSRAETIYGGSNEIQRNIVAERILGLPREPRG
jgi:alkylation response protein AidB-like acyl-CoA dehydrogenase